MNEHFSGDLAKWKEERMVCLLKGYIRGGVYGKGSSGSNEEEMD